MQAVGESLSLLFFCAGNNIRVSKQLKEWVGSWRRRRGREKRHISLHLAGEGPQWEKKGSKLKSKFYSCYHLYISVK